ncbi:MAG: COX15/CtaA family protein [Acidobacteria bacterium]|nr:COX15/CtaA family protein [Acidobacteriota bacterium]
MKLQSGPIWLHGLAVLTAGATFLLLIAGALVVGNEAGLAVPDWPLSYGTWMPPMEGGIFYEHGHRMVATFVGFLMTVLALALWWKEPRRWVRRLGLIAWLAVVAQGILGGITVLYLLPKPISVSHACLAQTFFCLTLTLALLTSPAWSASAMPLLDDATPRFRHLCAVATAAVFVQLILGATLRHKAIGLTPHLAGAGVVSVLVGWVLWRAVKKWPAPKTLKILSLAAGVLLILQLALGYESYLLRVATQEAVQPQFSVVLATTAHVAVGALLLGICWVMTMLAYRPAWKTAEAASLAGSLEKIWA